MDFSYLDTIKVCNKSPLKSLVVAKNHKKTGSYTGKFLAQEIF